MAMILTECGLSAILPKMEIGISALLLGNKMATDNTGLMEGIQKATNTVMAARYMLEEHPGYYNAVALQKIEQNRTALQHQLTPLRLVTNGD